MDALITTLTVELLYWAGCPSHGKAQAMVECALDKLALSRAHLRVRQIVTMEDAKREHFVGSPTIRVNARDIVPTMEEPALSCRVYRSADGVISALPDLRHLSAALEHALAAPIA